MNFILKLHSKLVLVQMKGKEMFARLLTRKKFDLKKQFLFE
jgi:hypothetical protein